MQVLATADQTLYELRRKAAADGEDSFSDREARNSCHCLSAHASPCLLMLLMSLYVWL